MRDGRGVPGQTRRCRPQQLGSGRGIESPAESRGCVGCRGEALDSGAGFCPPHRSPGGPAPCKGRLAGSSLMGARGAAQVHERAWLGFKAT